MYKELIKNWLPNLTPKLIKDYGTKTGINLTDSETTIVYQFIMKNYIEILEGNEKSFEELKKQVSPTLYQQLLQLYQTQKRKYF